jgi:hypothetical protein
MSPTRRQQFVPSRPRSELIGAVAVGVGIVAGTILIIWLIRPGTAGVPGGGGLVARQPRMTILLALAAAAIGVVVALVGRARHRPRFGSRGAIAVGSATVVVLAVVGGIFWPGGVVRHWPKLPKLAPTPSTNPLPSTPLTTGTTVKTGTTAKTGTTVAAPTSTPAASATTTPPTTGG